MKQCCVVPKEIKLTYIQRINDLQETYWKKKGTELCERLTTLRIILKMVWVGICIYNPQMCMLVLKSS